MDKAALTAHLDAAMADFESAFAEISAHPHSTTGDNYRPESQSPSVA